MQISSTLLMGFDQFFGVRSGFSRLLSRVLGPQKLYFRKFRVLKSYSLVSIEPIVIDETAHDGIVETGVSSENFYDASQVETPTSEHAIETAVKAAVTADETL
jgi:hypothetical protein